MVAVVVGRECLDVGLVEDLSGVVEFVCLESVVQDVHWDVEWEEPARTGDPLVWEGGVEEAQGREQEEKGAGD